jgi:diaminopimelate decarboxylase
MLSSNELAVEAALEAVAAIVHQAVLVSKALEERLEFINVGGGLGIPYHPGEAPFDIGAFGQGCTRLLTAGFPDSVTRPSLFTECGRYLTGPHGVLVTRVINRHQKAKTVIGVDASMNALMRPALYGAYHHITLPLVSTRSQEVVDVVGSMCENNDKFAVDRTLSSPRVGDVLVLHDTGAHGSSMGNNYNGRLRPQEILLRADGSAVQIRRAETLADYFATLIPLPGE